jgi:hypothetical protein
MALVPIDSLPIANIGNLTDRGLITQAGETKTLPLSLFPISNAVATALALRPLLSQKNQANGYAGLDVNGRILIAQLGSGTPDGTKFLRDDGVFAHPPSSGGGGGGSVAFGAITGVFSDNSNLNSALTARQLLSEKNQNNGYAGLNSSGLVAAAQLGTGGSSTDFLRKDGTWATPAAGGATVTFTTITGLPSDNTALTAALAAKQNTIGYTTENVANKSTSLASPSNTSYPTTQAVATALAGYAPLVSGKVNLSLLGTGATNNTTFLRGDGAWVVPATGSNLPSQTGNSGKYLTTDGSNLSWGTVSGGSGGSTVVNKPFTSVAFSGSSYTVDMADTANNISLTGVNASFTLIASNSTSGCSKTIEINKTTAGTITMTVDTTTFPGACVEDLSPGAIKANATSPLTFTITAGNNAVILLHIFYSNNKPIFLMKNLINVTNAVDASVNFKTIYPPIFSPLIHNTNTTTETILATIPFTANLFKALAYLRIYYNANLNSDGGSPNSGKVIFRLRLGTTGITSPQIENIDYTFTGSYTFSDRRFAYVNFISTTQARTQPNWISYNQVPVNIISVDTTVAMNLYLTIEKLVGTDNADMSDIIFEAGNIL